MQTITIQQPKDFEFPTIEQIAKLGDSDETFYQLTTGGLDMIFCKTEKNMFICTLAARRPHKDLPNVAIYEELMSIQFRIEKDEKEKKWVLRRKENDSEKVLTFDNLQDMMFVETI